MIALLETRTNSCYVKQSIMRKIKLDEGMFVEASGFGGGIWLFWDNSRIHIEEISKIDEILTVLVCDSNNRRWVVSIIYASPLPLLRDDLWTYLSKLGEIIHLSWLVIGDCNQPLNSCDKKGGRPINRSRASKLQTVIDRSQLLDLGYRGPKYTWTNMRKGSALIQERINRAWCNLRWHHEFAKAYVRHLPRMSSNHHPLLVCGLQKGNKTNSGGFRFLEAWFHHPNFAAAVESNWKQGSKDLGETIHQFRVGIQD